MTKITKAGKCLVFILLVVTVNQLIAQTYQQDNFILKLSDGVNVIIQRGNDGLFDYGVSELDALNEQYGVIRMEKMFVDEIGNDLAQYYRVFLSESHSDIALLLDSYQSLSSVEFVELQTVAELLNQNHPNDPLYNFSLNGGSGTQEQWYLYNDGDMNDDGTPDGLVRADIYAPEAWYLQTGRSDVILSYSDTGIEWEHDDLENNLWINVEEDANGNGSFDNYSISSGGDFGDANGDGCPGGCGVDDDGDGYTDFNDPGVQAIFTNGLDDDRDGTTQDELGGTLDDSPGTVGVDDDGDGIIDDYDGAISDDDENGYVDDVIGYDFAQWDPEPQPSDGHGISVAGDMGAITNNGTGVAGVAWGCKIMTTKIFGGYWRSSEAVYYSAKNDAHVHNMSWTGGILSTTLSDVYTNYNMLLIAAAGNHNENPPVWPSRSSYVMSIAGINSYDEKYYIDPATGSGYGTQIELCAAHKPITIAWSNNSYAFFGSGTSHSSPIVAGVAGLVISELLDAGYSNYSVQLVRDILNYTGDDIDYANQGQPWEGLLGNGRVNAYNAVNLIQSPPATPQNFTVSGNVGDNPTCSWSANNEPDLAGYKLYKNEAGSGWALFRTLDKNTTSYTDNSVIIGSGGKGSDNVCYKVSAYDIMNQESPQTWPRCKPLGGVSKEMVDVVLELIPNIYAIDPAYPNPFNPSTKISYQLPNESQVSLSIYSLQGKLIRSLISSKQDAGFYTIVWNGLNNAGETVSSGMYLILINASSTEDNSAFKASQKVVLLR